MTNGWFRPRRSLTPKASERISVMPDALVKNEEIDSKCVLSVRIS